MRPQPKTCPEFRKYGVKDFRFLKVPLLKEVLEKYYWPNSRIAKTFMQ